MAKKMTNVRVSRIGLIRPKSNVIKLTRVISCSSGVVDFTGGNVPDDMYKTLMVIGIFLIPITIILAVNNSLAKRRFGLYGSADMLIWWASAIGIGMALRYYPW